MSLWLTITFLLSLEVVSGSKVHFVPTIMQIKILVVKRKVSLRDHRTILFLIPYRLKRNFMFRFNQYATFLRT